MTDITIFFNTWRQLPFPNEKFINKSLRNSITTSTTNFFRTAPESGSMILFTRCSCSCDQILSAHNIYFGRFHRHSPSVYHSAVCWLWVSHHWLQCHPPQPDHGREILGDRLLSHWCDYHCIMSRRVAVLDGSATVPIELRSEATRPHKPHIIIVIILADDMGFRRVSCELSFHNEIPTSILTLSNNMDILY